MANHIYVPSKDELNSRIGRFDDYKQMSTAKDLEWVGQDAMDLYFARQLMPVILEDDKGPFGKLAPINDADGITMFVSIMPPGQGPCLHSHNSTYETFMVLDGTIEYYVGDPVEHTVVLNKWDTFSCPPGVYRGFKNTGDIDAVQLTIISGLNENSDDVSVPDSVARETHERFGKDVAEAFRKIIPFDPPQAAAE